MRKLGLSRLFPIVFQVALGVGALTCTTGCGALSALTNPKAAWAVSEPAPMSVIVRRAEVAHGTARQVERLLGETGINDKSRWVAKTAIKNADAEATLKDVGNEPVYASAKVRVVPAEVWLEKLSSICSDEGKYPSLLASITPELAKSFDEVNQANKTVAELKGKIAEEDKAIDDKSQADKRDEHEKTKRDLEDQLSKAQDDVKPKLDKFLASVRDEAQKAKPEVKDRVGVAVVNLKRAVDDAKLANAVALIRYPMAVPTLKDDATASAKRIVADVVEERTGTRPDVNQLNIDVKLDGGSVKLGLQGVPADKLGALAPDEVIAETTKRMKDYVGRVLTLVAYAGETQETLSFESDVLDALSEGLKLAPSPDAGDAIADLKIETTGVPGGKRAKHHPGTHSGVGLVASGTCGKPEKAEPRAEVVVAKADAKTKSAPKVLKPVKVEPRQAKASGAVVPASIERPAPEKPAAKKGDGACEVSVTNGDTKICL